MAPTDPRKVGFRLGRRPGGLRPPEQPVEAKSRGRILREPRGTQDFGYDPQFLFNEPGFAQTGHGFAELEPPERARASRRGRVLARLVEAWNQLR